jgi:esterase FrsA
VTSSSSGELAKDFPVHFERRIIEIPYRGEIKAVPARSPVLALRMPARSMAGGLDTFTMDFHPWCLAFTMNAGEPTPKCT